MGAPYSDHATTTFVYVGDAESVRVVHFMGRFPEIPPLLRLDGTSLWHVTVELPQGSRVEYKLEVTDQERTDRILDPLNRRTASDPFGSNSVAHAPGYADPPWVSPGVDFGLGTVETLEIDHTAFGGTRLFSVYLPDRYPDEAPYPVAVLHDGSDLLEYASLTTVLDNLIGAEAVRPHIAVLLDPTDRSREYAALPEHGRFVTEDVLPHVSAELGGSTHPADRLIAGASLGGVASLATAWRHPGTFGSLVLLSGSFVTGLGGPWKRGPLLRPVVDFVARFTEEPGRPSDRVWMAVGAYETLADDNRRFRPVLQGTGMAVSYREPLDGHHWQSWRNSLGEALRALLPADPPDHRPSSVAT